MRHTPWPVLYFVLGSIVVLSAVLSQLAPGNEVVQRFGPGLATETLGILLTLVFVQRFLERQDRVRRLRSSLGALRRGSRALSRLLEVWSMVVKGGLRHPPRYPPDSLLELLEPHYTQAIGDIDPAAPRGEGGGPDWGVWTAQELRGVRGALREVIRVYGTSLDAEYVEALDALLDDEFFDLFLELAEARQDGDAEWQVGVRQIAGAREGHFRRLLAVVELHNQLAHEAAEIRDPKRLPQTRGVGMDLPADWDLRVHHTLTGNWWKTEPEPGSLRMGGARPSA